MQEKVSLFQGRGKSFESINVKLFQREEREVGDERCFFGVWVVTANRQPGKRFLTLRLYPLILFYSRDRRFQL